MGSRCVIGNGDLPSTVLIDVRAKCVSRDEIIVGDLDLKEFQRKRLCDLKDNGKLLSYFEISSYLDKFKNETRFSDLVRYTLIVSTVNEMFDIDAFCLPIFQKSLHQDNRLELSLMNIFENIYKIYLDMPFINWGMDKIIYTGWELGSDMSNSIDCPHFDVKHCGVCERCLIRREGFKLAGVQDFTNYR